MDQTLSLTILLVDDDAEDMMLFREAVRRIDPAISLQHAQDGVDALSRLNAPGAIMPDYIFLDLNMPRMNGKECLAALKKSPALRHLPVIICTTSRRASDVEETRQMGATSFVTKPMSFNDLISVICFALEKHEAGEYLRTLVEIF